MNQSFNESLKKIENFVKINDFEGFDPYDALNSPRIKKIRHKWIKIFFTQLFVYSPINFRHFFGVRKEINPKSIGLILSSYAYMRKANLIREQYFKTVIEKLIEILLKSRTLGYSGYCWGFNFDWQDINRYAPKSTPTIVISSYIGHGLLDIYEITRNRNYLEMANKISIFITKDLNVNNFREGISFSYTPIDNHIVHNANGLGASLLIRLYHHTNNNDLFELSKKSFDYIISKQNSDGSWSYSIDMNTNKERKQIDFHQGFILDSIYNFLKYSGLKSYKYTKSFRKGFSFYKHQQFLENGKSKWRLPYRYPQDIHHQAQGIISFINAYDITNNKKLLNFSQTIAKWTIKNMQDTEGYFYYQLWPFLTNKIPYMRWGQAWMMLALSKLYYKEYMELMND